MIDSLIEKINSLKNPTAVGLDTDVSYLSDDVRSRCKTADDAAKYVLDFNVKLIDKIKNIVPCVKIQVAYYELLGAPGFDTFAKTAAYAKKAGLFVIADVKRNDIGSTASAYSKAYFASGGAAPFDSDFITVNGYLGTDGIAPFVKDCAAFDRGIFVLVKTSNPSSGELQDLVLNDGRTVYEAMGALVEEWGKSSRGRFGYSSVGAVVGATHPTQAARLRKAMPHTFFLVPGYGAQGGTADDLSVCFDERGNGAVVNSSRGILCAYKSEKYKSADPFSAAYNACIDMREDLMRAVARK